jgi:hypothetical protein
MLPRFFSLCAIGLCLEANVVFAADLSVHTNFEGGSARIEKIDQAMRTISISPGGDPSRGWPCWWFFRVEGTAAGETLMIDLGASPAHARNNGKDTKKPLSSDWCMPKQAAYSLDGKIWKQTEPGTRQGERIVYQVPGQESPLWVAWGPAFTPRQTDELIEELTKTKTCVAFELAKTREERAVKGLHFQSLAAKKMPVVWIQARQHAWESGASWVARGYAEWLASDEDEAKWLREHAEIYLIPIMDVDNVATGNGGKEADPRDHNRDWDDKPVYSEVAAAQKKLLEFAKEDRLAVFLELHNPGANDKQPYFYTGSPDLLSEQGRTLRTKFLEKAAQRIKSPLPLAEKPKLTGPSYHPLWKQISNQWVNDHGNPKTFAACLETSWNTPSSNTEGYRAVGKQLGQATSDFIRDAKQLK